MERGVMPARSLTATQRELLAATAIVGIIGALPGTVEAWRREGSTEVAPRMSIKAEAVAVINGKSSGDSIE